MSDDYYKTEVEEFDKHFEFLTGDVCWEDYGGKWFRRVSRTRFHVVEIHVWDEHVGQDESPATYNLSIYEVDVEVGKEIIESALSSCGFAFDDDGNIINEYDGDILSEPDEENYQTVLCDVLVGYGAYAPFDNWNGDDYKELFHRAVELSNEIVGSDEKYEEMMGRPINAIGSTAREYQHGDLDAGLCRKLAEAEGDDLTRARIVAKMQFAGDGAKALEELAKTAGPDVASEILKMNRRRTQIGS